MRTDGASLAIMGERVYLGRDEYAGSWRLRVVDPQRIAVREQDDALIVSVRDDDASCQGRTAREGEGTTNTSLGSDSFADFGAAADRVVDDWMARMPECAPHRLSMMRECWWTLGINTIDMLIDGLEQRVIVPSKRGYVGLWQWDAYFIAMGVAHGDLDLALQQFHIAMRFQGDDGQLPDVVHENGVLASSDDLPPADRLKLEADGSASIGLGAVPLTKPPLTAWALEQVLAFCPPSVRAQQIKRFSHSIAKSQEWWFASGGRPMYAHPYSSGLDDSPIFDYELPVETADLLAYLVRQDEILASWHQQELLSSSNTTNFYARRAQNTRHFLLELWDPDELMFIARNDHRQIKHRTIVHLLASFAGGLPEEISRHLVNDIQSGNRFSSQYSLPVVSFEDEAYRPDIMWRGPVWANTAYLVADGMQACGHERLAQKLRAAIMKMIETAGPVEYVNAVTGVRCDQAASAFSWSAALYVDLAVREHLALG
ncbi:MGH1-like glycoside hydrolase domain-containing protein [Schaalia vaccimaxillae]|uniref:MGH1-like glycoside hydrolase domain-containing protein n=1 Tax=Schaalia vaccimaxillae TaxID=183916 RepID=UPI00103C3860|nr:hypothetical protein [Schaalia vaccimaxillae]